MHSSKNVQEFTWSKGAVWYEEGSNSDSNQQQEFKEPETEKRNWNTCFYVNLKTLSELQFLCLATRVQPPGTTQGWHTEAAVLQYKPVLDGSSRVLAAAHSDHDDGEEEEEAGHGEAHAVDWFITHDDVTVHLAFYARYTWTTHTEAGDLMKEDNRDTERKRGQ